MQSLLSIERKLAFIILLILSEFIAAQKGTTRSNSLAEKVKSSDLVVEGQVLAVKGFRPNRGQVYTSAIVKVSKIFKGNISDSTIEIVYLGGYTDSIVSMSSHGLSLTKGMEGIFLLNQNITGNKLTQGLLSYQLNYDRRSYIAYHEEKYMVAHHVATCVGETYDDLERDLFEPIERITGLPRKVLGPNMFERK